MVWHVLTLGAMITCSFLAAWQWERAGSSMGSTVNIGYGIQWPIFAVFFGVMWWRFLSLELRELRAAGDAGAASAVVAAPAIPAPPGAAAPAAGPQAAPAGPSPFRRSPQRPAAVSDAEDPELAEYNRMLAALAERDARSG